MLIFLSKIADKENYWAPVCSRTGLSCPAACQCSAADWLQVQEWRGPGKFLTTVPKYLDVSRPTLTDDFLKAKKYAFYGLRPLQRSTGKNSWVWVRTIVEVICFLCMCTWTEKLRSGFWLKGRTACTKNSGHYDLPQSSNIWQVTCDTSNLFYFLTPFMILYPLLCVFTVLLCWFYSSVVVYFQNGSGEMNCKVWEMYPNLTKRSPVRTKAPAETDITRLWIARLTEVKGIHNKS